VDNLASDLEVSERRVVMRMGSDFAGSPVGLSGVESKPVQLCGVMPLIQCFHKSAGIPEAMNYEEKNGPKRRALLITMLTVCRGRGAPRVKRDKVSGRLWRPPHSNHQEVSILLVPSQAELAFPRA
jgi:hypothetical protein